jgi:UDP-GlcNAc:undecaprenyl-phosphate GlcNAc-1-phosphate transferase
VNHLVLAVTAAAFALGVTPLVRAIATRLGVVDRPGERRLHDAPVPRLGGIAVLVAGLGAFLLAPLLGVPVAETLALHGWRLWWLLAGVLVVVATGVADDVRGLAPGPKLVFQTAAGAIALAGGYQLVGFTNPLTGVYVELGALGGVLTLAWILFVTNAVNLVDGLDGLAAGVTTIAAATLLCIAGEEGRPDAAYMWALLLGAVLGFLPYNWNPASIFLGDSGSLLLGYALAVLSIQSLQKGATAVVVIAPILALGLPIMETMLTVLRRAVSSGVTSVFRPDQEHLHHRLLALGIPQRAAVLILYGVCVAFNVVAFLSVLVQGVAQAVLVALGVAVLVAVVRQVRARQRDARAA